MALEDHFVKVAGLLGIEAPQAEVVDDQEIRSEETAESLVGGMVGARLMELLQEMIGAEEEHLVAGAAGRVTERTGEKGLSDADRPEEDYVLLALDEAEGEEIADTIAVEGDRGIPVEAFEGVLLFLEAGAAEALGEILLVAPIDFVLEDKLEEVELAELGFLGVGDAVRNRGESAGELQALEDGLERLGDFHGRHCSFLVA